MSTNNNQRRVFHVILFTLFVLMIGGNFDNQASSASAITDNATQSEQTNWTLEKAREDLRISTRSTRDSEHEFSVLMNKDSCQMQAIQLKFHTTVHIADTLPNQGVRLNLYLGNRRAMIFIPMTMQQMSDDGLQIQLATFYLNTQLRDDLLANNTLRIDVLEPIQLAHSLNHSEVKFSLQGLNDSGRLLSKLCESEPTDREASYTLLHDVL